MARTRPFLAVCALLVSGASSEPEGTATAGGSYGGGDSSTDVCQGGAASCGGTPGDLPDLPAQLRRCERVFASRDYAGALACHVDVAGWLPYNTTVANGWVVARLNRSGFGVHDGQPEGAPRAGGSYVPDTDPTPTANDGGAGGANECVASDGTGAGVGVGTAAYPVCFPPDNAGRCVRMAGPGSACKGNSCCRPGPAADPRCLACGRDGRCRDCAADPRVSAAEGAHAEVAEEYTRHVSTLSSTAAVLRDNSGTPSWRPADPGDAAAWDAAMQGLGNSILQLYWLRRDLDPTRQRRAPAALQGSSLIRVQKTKRGAGMGVVAAADIPAGTSLGPYPGRMRPFSDLITKFKALFNATLESFVKARHTTRAVRA